jgi:hypothetical protein
MAPDSVPLTLNSTPGCLELVAALVILSHRLVRALATDINLVKEGLAQNRREVEETDLTFGRQDIFNQAKHLLVCGKRCFVGELVGLTIVSPFDGK